MSVSFSELPIHSKLYGNTHHCDKILCNAVMFGDGLGNLIVMTAGIIINSYDQYRIFDKCNYSNEAVISTHNLY